MFGHWLECNVFTEIFRWAHYIIQMFGQSYVRQWNKVHQNHKLTVFLPHVSIQFKCLVILVLDLQANETLCTSQEKKHTCTQITRPLFSFFKSYLNFILRQVLLTLFFFWSGFSLHAWIFIHCVDFQAVNYDIYPLLSQGKQNEMNNLNKSNDEKRWCK